MSVGSVFVSLLAGAFGWVILSFVGAPLRNFFDIRGEVIRRSIEFANVRGRWVEVRDNPGEVRGERIGELSDEDIARLDEKRRVFRDLASRMRAFAENEPAVWVVVHILRYDPKKASNALMGLSNTVDVYTASRAFYEKELNAALRIKL